MTQGAPAPCPFHSPAAVAARPRDRPGGAGARGRRRHRLEDARLRSRRRVVPLCQGRARQRHRRRLGFGHAVRGHHGAGRFAGLGTDQGALRRLQLAGEEGPAPRAHRPGDLRAQGAPGRGRPRGRADPFLDAAGRRRCAALAGVARRGSTADDAKRDLDRKESLVAKGFISAAERDKALFVYDARRRGGDARRSADPGRPRRRSPTPRRSSSSARRRWRGARVDLSARRSSRPVDGVVISRQVDAGQTVAASLNTPTLFSIAQDLRADAGRGRRSTRRTSARSESASASRSPSTPSRARTFDGKVRQIRKAAQTVQNVVTYTVVVATDESRTCCWCRA